MDLRLFIKPLFVAAIAHGADAFAHEKFGGSGRVCESCHLGGGLLEGRRPDGVAIPSCAPAASAVTAPDVRSVHASLR